MQKSTSKQRNKVNNNSELKTVYTVYVQKKKKTVHTAYDEKGMNDQAAALILWHMVQFMESPFFTCDKDISFFPDTNIYKHHYTITFVYDSKTSLTSKPTFGFVCHELIFNDNFWCLVK